jgi:hypothetical protein
MKEMISMSIWYICIFAFAVTAITLFAKYILFLAIVILLSSVSFTLLELLRK